MHTQRCAAGPSAWIKIAAITWCGKSGTITLHDEKNIIYGGRGEAPARLDSHANTPGKSHLQQLIIFDNNLTKAEIKFLVQRIMVLNGGAKSVISLKNLINKIRSFSPYNLNASTYDIAGHNSDWGGKVLKDALSILKGNSL
ncbi:hypothetical protein [Enterobacter sp. HSTU-ASh6]|uniref:hypothetical protein n=1 Tax=Enterobacter sp. HSTU-ASh6 TaxID=2678687 RepID=UPI002258894E|nr:hypothetical protein [Enterobacter sp. HSTU-ASh6]MCX4181210.1 hypothetical protein [Enterobacter sp. HSTU-ASh6]